jgi:hypothetical protein
MISSNVARHVWIPAWIWSWMKSGLDFTSASSFHFILIFRGCCCSFPSKTPTYFPMSFLHPSTALLTFPFNGFFGQHSIKLTQFIGKLVIIFPSQKLYLFHRILKSDWMNSHIAIILLKLDSNKYYIRPVHFYATIWPLIDND